jgi:hypothetical protein
MASATIQDFRSAQLPFSEQLLRLNRLRKHLKAFLCRYTFEPRTEEAFRQREALWDELNALEVKCLHMSGLLKKGGGALETLKKDFLNLHNEFNGLEAKVRRYLDQC